MSAPNYDIGHKASLCMHSFHTWQRKEGDSLKVIVNPGWPEAGTLHW